MSITINGATNTLTAASGLTIAGNTAVTGTLSATGLGTFSSGVFTDSGALQIGADIGASSITNATRKFGAITTPHYTNAQEKVVLASVDSDAASTLLNIGGGSSSFNSPTAVYVYAQAAVDTGSGSVVGTFSSTGLAVTGTLSLNETVPAGITLNVFNASETGTTMGGNTLLRLASNASGADSTIQFTDSVANNAYISGKSGHIYIQPNTAGISVADFSSTALTLGSGVKLLPTTDNTQDIGAAATGFKEIFADNGTINTSDARRKTEVSALSAAEINAAKQLAKEIGSFKFLAAVAEKGDAARNHIGMTVQRAIAIMEGNGLDPFAYSFICHDVWDDEFVEHPAIEAVSAKEAVIDEDGNVVTPAVEAVAAVDAWTEQTKVAGDKYSFRVHELLLFMAAGFEARLAALEAA